MKVVFLADYRVGAALKYAAWDGATWQTVDFKKLTGGTARSTVARIGTR